MKRQCDFFVNEQYFKHEGKLTVDGNMYIKNNAYIEELTVQGNCFIDGALTAKKMIVFGNLYANKLVVKDELEVQGDAEIEFLSGGLLKFLHNLKVAKANVHHSVLIVGEGIKAHMIFGDLAELSIGKLT